MGYFAPTIIAFQQMPPSPTVDPALVQKAAQWRNLNLIRVLAFLIVNLAFFPLIARVGGMASRSAAGFVHRPSEPPSPKSWRGE